MARTLRWSEVAVEDLENAAAYIARDSPFHAALFVEEVLAAAQTLCLFPGRGRRVPELPEHDLRELILKNYRLIYRAGDERLEIVTLVHGARDLPSAIDPKILDE